MINFLRKLSLISDDNALSLTNIGFYVVLYRLAIGPSEWDALIGVAILGNYAHKRFTVAKEHQGDVKNMLEIGALVEAQSADIKKMQSLVNSLAIKYGLTTLK